MYNNNFLAMQAWERAVLNLLESSSNYAPMAKLLFSNNDEMAQLESRFLIEHHILYKDLNWC